MKKVLLWLAKIFRVNLTIEKIVYKDKIIEIPKEIIKEVIVEKQIALDGEIDGDVTVRGNLLVTGTLSVTGGLTCLVANEINNSLKNK